MNKQDFEEVKKRFELESRRRKNISLILNYMSIIVAGITLSIFASKYFFTDYSSDFSNSLSHSIKIDDLKNQIVSLKSELKKEKKISDSLKKNNLKTEVDISSLRVLKLENAVQNLNKVILEDPEKAVSIPLLKSDIEHLKEQNQNDIKVMREEIAKAYDTNKWIIGLVSTMLVSIIALNISNLLAKKKE